MQYLRYSVLAAAVALAIPTSAQASQPACVIAGAYTLRHNPAAIPGSYRNCSPTIARELQSSGIAPTRRNTRAAWAMAVTNRVAPYGSHRFGWSFENLRTMPFLECAGYAVLATEVYLRVGGRRSDVRFVGWRSGPTGNHAQVWIGRDLLIDPTAGVAALIDRFALVHGKRTNAILSMVGNDTDRGQVARHRIAGGFHDRLIQALRSGAFRYASRMYTQSYAQRHAYHRALVAAHAAGRPWEEVPIPGFIWP